MVKFVDNSEFLFKVLKKENKKFIIGSFMKIFNFIQVIKKVKFTQVQCEAMRSAHRRFYSHEPSFKMPYDF